MPRIFNRVAPQNLSHSEAVERETVVPAMEHYAGDNNPYRGIESHGVAPTVKPLPPDDYSTRIGIEYEDVPLLQEAVPVQIVNKTNRFRRIARADNRVLAYTGRPFQLLPREENRVKVQIMNINTFFRVDLGFTDQVRDFTGSFPMSTNVLVELVTTDEVWGFIADNTATNVRIGWIAEYEIPIDD